MSLEDDKKHFMSELRERFEALGERVYSESTAMLLAIAPRAPHIALGLLSDARRARAARKPSA